MGPRFFDRGNTIGAEGKGPTSWASMGPRFFDRGNQRCELQEHLHATLQWGRGSLTEETPV